MVDLLGSITRLAVYAVPYRRGARDLIIGHVGERTMSGKQIGFKVGTRRGQEKDAQIEEEIAYKEQKPAE